jgi:4-hydroxy-tetrahydrodipicolinate synthase
LSSSDPLAGAHTLAITPFDSAGDLDRRSLASLVDFLLDGGVDGVIALGTTGEFFTLSPSERVSVMEEFMRAVGRRVPVTFGVADSSTRQSVVLAQRAEELGAACVMLPAPYYFAHSRPAVEAHFAAVAASTRLPLMVYDGGGGIEVPVDLLASLRAQAPNVRYVKLSLPQPAKVAAVVARAAGVAPLCGDDTMLVLALRHGAIGSTIGIGNLLPKAVSEVHAAFASGDLATARRIHRQHILPAVGICGTSKSEYIGCFKDVLHRKGVIASAATRPPLQPLDALRREELLAVMTEIGVL